MGDKFYIILSGEVIGSLEPSFDMEQYTANFVEQELFKLSTGASFGELALINESSRSCSIKASGIVQLISLTKTAFLDNCGDVMTQKVKKIEDFLNSCDNLKQFSEDEINLLASKLIAKKYAQNYKIQAQNSEVNNFYILTSGVISVQRLIDKKSVDFTKFDPLVQQEFHKLPEIFPMEIREIIEPGACLCV